MEELLGLKYIQYGFAGFCVILVTALMYLVMKGFKHLRESDERKDELSDKIIGIVETNTKALTSFEGIAEGNRKAIEDITNRSENAMREMTGSLKEIHEHWKKRNGN